VRRKKSVWSWFPVGESRIVELLEATSDDSPCQIHRQARRRGCIIVCMRVPDLAAAVAKLKKDGCAGVGRNQDRSGRTPYVLCIRRARARAAGVGRERALNDAMKLLLAVDTSGKNGVWRGARDGGDVQLTCLKLWPLTGGAFSAQLVPQIARCSKRHGHTRTIWEHLPWPMVRDRLWVARGLAAMKALAKRCKADGSDFIAGIGRVRRVWAGARFRRARCGRGDVYVGAMIIDRQTPLCGSHAQ